MCVEAQPLRRPYTFLVTTTSARGVRFRGVIPGAKPDSVEKSNWIGARFPPSTGNHTCNHPKDHKQKDSCSKVIRH